jgi:hypothetical protein
VGTLGFEKFSACGRPFDFFVTKSARVVGCFVSCLGIAFVQKIGACGGL